MNTAGSLLGLMWRAARWRLVGVTLLATLLSLTEGISLAMVLPLIALLGANSAEHATAATAGPHTLLLFHLLTVLHIPPSAWLATLLLIVVASVGLMAQWNGLLASLTLSIVLAVQSVLAEELYQAILYADWAYLTKRRSSDFAHHLTTELNRVGALASNVIGLLSSAAVAALLLSVTVAVAPALTLLLGLGFAFLIPWQRRRGAATYESGVAISAKMRAVFDSATERLGNLKVVKAYGAQAAEHRMFRKRYEAVIAELMRNEWQHNASSRTFQVVTLVMLCGVILLALYPFHLRAAALLLFLFAFVRVTPRLNVIQSKAQEILSDLPAYDSARHFLSDCHSHAEALSEHEPAPSLRHELCLGGVSYRYAPGSAAVVDDLQLTLPAGKITAIAGVSGAGKSTVADLIMGLLTPEQGMIEIDGTELTRHNARSWRNHVGYVSQDTLLFHSTVRENLLWARPAAEDEALRRAIEEAEAGFVYALPSGIETVVGDRGVMLSHGQRQRIALARALLLEPTLLILDEATNSLDLETEANILRTVQRFGSAVTTLLISHRPSALQFASFVYFLEHGRVGLSGSWADVQRKFDETREPR